MTLYRLKPGFQALLRPAASRLARAGVSANQVTLAAAAGSIALGAFVAANADRRGLFLLIAIWLLVRMALNAVDGLMARGFGQRTPLGVYLNEIGDVVSDAALYLPFALVAPFGLPLVGLIVFLSVVSEFAGVLGTMAGASRRYDGPMGKSDRALVFAVLSAAVAFVPTLPQWTAWGLGLVALLICLTIARRVTGGLAQERARASRVAGPTEKLGIKGAISP